MKTTKLFFMAALALTFAACSNDDNDLTTQQPQKAEGITITAQLAPKTNGATTRAVSEGGGRIFSYWAVNEHIAVLYEVGGTKYAADATITAVDYDDLSAIIEFTVEAGTPDNTACTLVYPYSAAKDDHTGVKDAATLLAAQDGTLNANLDVRVGEGTIQTTTPGLDVTTQPEAQFAIFKFTLSGQSIDATHPLVIKKGENDVVTTVTPTSSATSVYVAMPPAASSTYRFIVTTDDNKYIKSGTAAITAGKYYQTTLNLTARYPLAPSSATVDDLGSVIASDGNIYLKNAATPSGNTAVAKICYVSGSNGLALALADETDLMNWSTAISTCAAHTPAITGGTWKLATKDEWTNMITAAGGYEALRNGFNSVGGSNLLGSYWSSTEGDSSNAWFLIFYDGYDGWVNDLKSYDNQVRACLAF